MDVSYYPTHVIGGFRRCDVLQPGLTYRLGYLYRRLVIHGAYDPCYGSSSHAGLTCRCSRRIERSPVATSTSVQVFVQNHLWRDAADEPDRERSSRSRDDLVGRRPVSGQTRLG